MQFDLYSCCICSHSFDRTTRIPKLIPTCGHTFCSECLSRIINQNVRHLCPLDNIAFPIAIERTEQFPTNLLILHVIEEKNKNGLEMCSKHQKPKDRVCTTDCSILCEACVVEHNGHNIKQISEVQSVAQEKIKQMKETLQERENAELEIDILLNDTRKSLATFLRKEFDEMEKELFQEIRLCLESEKNTVDSELNNDAKLKEDIDLHISDLNTNNLSRRFFRTLSWKIPESKVKLELERLSRKSRDMKSKYQSIVGNLKTSLKAMVKENNLSNEHKENTQVEAPSTTNTMENLENILNQIVENQSIIIEPQDQTDSLDNVKKYLDVDLKDDITFIRLRGPVEENNLEFCSLPNIEKLSEVKAVNFVFSSHNLTNPCVEALKSLWKLFSNVSSVAIYFSGEFDDNDLALLCTDPFWATEKITHFRFINSTVTLENTEELEPFSETQSRVYLSEAGLKSFAGNIIPRLTGLLTLAIDLGHIGVKDRDVELLIQEVNKLSKNLKALTLGLNNTDVGNKSIEALAKGFCFNSLEKFELFLGDCKHVTNSSIKTLCTKMKNFTVTAKSLVLNLRNTKITDKCIFYLDKDVLEKMSSLERLEILLDGIHIPNTSLVNMFTHLRSSSKTLRKLRLGLNKTQISDESIEHLGTLVLPAMSCLESLSLELENTNVSDKSIYFVGVNVMGLMKNIERFFLDVRHTKVIGGSLEEFFGSIHIASLTKLKHFEVYIDEKDEPVNVSVQSLLYEIYYQLANKMAMES